MWNIYILVMYSLKSCIEHGENRHGLVRVESVSNPPWAVMIYWSNWLHVFPMPSWRAPRLHTIKYQLTTDKAHSVGKTLWRN